MANKKTKEKKATISWQMYLFWFCMLVLAAVFLPSTVLLLIGMVPTMVAAFVDRSRRKPKAVTVGGMNLAGCMPFLMELWNQGNEIPKALEIVSDPMAIVVMYSAAGVGYIIDWTLSGLIAGVLYQRGQARLRAIEKRKEEIVERWGREVTGVMALDKEGFPISGDVVSAPDSAAKPRPKPRA